MQQLTECKARSRHDISDPRGKAVMSSATSDMDDEDTTVLSADSHPYLSLSSERPHSVDSSVHSRHGRSARSRPQTAPSLEAVVNSSCDRASNPESLQASGFFYCSEK